MDFEQLKPGYQLICLLKKSSNFYFDCTTPKIAVSSRDLESVVNDQFFSMYFVFVLIKNPGK